MERLHLLFDFLDHSTRCWSLILVHQSLRTSCVVSAIIAISDPRAYRRVRVFDLKQFFLSPLEYSTVQCTYSSVHYSWFDSIWSSNVIESEWFGTDLPVSSYWLCRLSTGATVTLPFHAFAKAYMSSANASGISRTGNSYVQLLHCDSLLLYFHSILYSSIVKHCCAVICFILFVES